MTGGTLIFGCSDTQIYHPKPQGLEVVHMLYNAKMGVFLPTPYPYNTII